MVRAVLVVAALGAIAGCGGSSGGRCTTSDECAATADCISGACVDGCHADRDCPSGVCAAHGRCVTPADGAVPGDDAGAGAEVGPADAAPADAGGAEAAPADAGPPDAAPADAAAADAAQVDAPQTDAAQSDAPRTDAPIDAPATDAADASPGDAACTSAGALRCLGQALEVCTAGAWQPVATCSAVCDPALGCVDCAPGTTYCVGDGVYQCTSQGHQGSLLASCGPGLCQNGACIDPCASLGGAVSSVGCDHWATVTSQSQLDATFDFSFGLALLNPGTTPATVTITGGALSTPRIVVLDPGSATTASLPFVAELAQRGATLQSVLAAGRGYHVQSTAPITVYQLEPLEASAAGPDCGLLGFCWTAGTCDPTSNKCVLAPDTSEASLVLPTAAHGRDYLVVTRPTWATRTCTYDSTSGAQYTTDAYPGFFAVVASQPGTTQVSVTFAGAAMAGAGVPTAYNAGQTGVFTLNQGDVLQIGSRLPASCTSAMQCDNGICTTGQTQTCYCDLSAGYDLTGTTISATQNVAVFAGHDTTRVPFWALGREHLEEQLWPVPTWGRTSVAVNTTEADSRPNVYRIVSGADGNTITLTPSSVGGPFTLNHGQFREVTTAAAFVATGTQRFLLAQFLVGRDYNGTGATNGDPALTLVAPVEQFRAEHRFFVPVGPTSLVSIVAPAGASITLDGTTVSLIVVGGTSWAAATARVAPGPHTVTASAPCGVQVYGAGNAMAYAYPAGLSLAPLP